MTDEDKKSSNKDVIIGIDLGTTNSCVAIMEGNSPTVIVNADGARTTPSVVLFKEGGEVVVGARAKRQAILYQGQVFASIKRFIGRTMQEVQEEEAKVSYKIHADPTNRVRVSILGEMTPPEDVSAKVLVKMKEAAENYLGHPVKKAVITIPAYFNDDQRQATKDAGRIAGLDVVRLLAEPTAAALAYGFDKKHEDKVIAVFDLGGGTFDISILGIGDGVFAVLATNGNTSLGGDDFDHAIYEWLLEEFKKSAQIDLSDRRCEKEHAISSSDRLRALQQLRDAAEKAKIELSGTLSSEICLPFLVKTDKEPFHLQVTLSRAKFESLAEPYLKRLYEPCQKALADAKKSASEIDEVILVGGMTRMPAVQAAVKAIFGKEPKKGVNPDEVVAIGAAIEGGVLSGSVKDVVLLDVTPLTLGLETLGGVSTPLIKRNSTIPIRKEQIFSTAADNQSSVTLHVTQGERTMAAQNKSIGTFELDGIPPAPRGKPQIKVTFEIDSNGIFSATAVDLTTNRKNSISVKTKGTLSEEEIAASIAEAERYAEEDKKHRETIEVLNDGESFLNYAEQQVDEYEKQLDAELVTAIKAKAADLKMALESKVVENVQFSKEALSKELQKIGEHLQKKAGTDAPPHQENAAHQEAPRSQEPPTEDADVEILDKE